MKKNLVEQELLTLPEHLSSRSVFSEIRVTRSLVLYVCFVLIRITLLITSWYLKIVLAKWGFYFRNWVLVENKKVVTEFFFTLEESLSESMLRIYTCIKMLIGMSEMKEIISLIYILYMYVYLSEQPSNFAKIDETEN